MKTLRFLMGSLLIVMTAVLTGCETDELKDDIEVLKNRVTNLENLVEDVNENVAAVQAILTNGKTIQSYKEENGTYTLILSDNSEIVLNQGAPGKVQMPEITVNEDDFWVINGEPTSVKASGDNGQTPKFRISEEGYWEVKIGDGAWERVKGLADGQEDGVLAIPTNPDGGEMKSFFKDVKVENGKLVVTMHDDAEYTLPIIPNLVAEIENPVDNYTDNLWYVVEGETATTKVNITGDNYFVTVPAGGWKADIVEENGVYTLSVVAPKALTRASANNKTELVLQVCNGTHWAFDKINVMAGPALETKKAMYDAGMDLIVGGCEGVEPVKINKNIFGEAVYIDSDTELANGALTGGVYFVKAGVSLKLNSAKCGNMEYLIVIGEDGEQLAGFELSEGSGAFKTNGTPDGANPKKGYYIWSNVKFANNSGTHFSAYGADNASQVKSMIFDSCEMTLKHNLIYFSKPGSFFSDLRFLNSTIKVVVGANSIYSPGDSNKTVPLGQMVMHNNVIYANEDKALILIAGVSAAIDKLVFTNNTFINLVMNLWNSGRMFSVNEIKSHITCKNNLFESQRLKHGIGVFETGIYKENPEGECVNNYFSGYSNVVMIWGGGKFRDTDDNIVKDTESLFATFDAASCRFVPVEKYSAFGAQHHNK